MYKRCVLPVKRNQIAVYNVALHACANVHMIDLIETNPHSLYVWYISMYAIILNSQLNDDYLAVMLQNS